MLALLKYKIVNQKLKLDDYVTRLKSDDYLTYWIAWQVLLVLKGLLCKQFTFAINLKSIGADCYYTLREKYIFPVIDTYWQTEQNRVLNSVKDRG